MRKTGKKMKIPEGFTAEDVKLEASICTGEKTIGFYSASEKRLVCAELVRTQSDIDAFYEKYGIKKM